MKSFDNYLFLLVEKGKKELEEVHRKFYSGILASELKENPPFIPHVTIGFFESQLLYETAYREAEEMKIEYKDILNTITLIKGDGKSPATTIKTFHITYS